jgi:hypothetical protein
VLKTVLRPTFKPATSRHRIEARLSNITNILNSHDLPAQAMESGYTQHTQPPQPPYSMAPGVPPNMPANDASYRRDAPGPSYHSIPVSQHQQNGQTYAYNPNPLPGLPPQRTPLPDQMMGSENGPAPPTNLAVTLPMGQMVNAGAPEPPSHSMIELGRRYTYV